jgi:hypothetical protein
MMTGLLTFGNIIWETGLKNLVIRVIQPVFGGAGQVVSCSTISRGDRPLATRFCIAIFHCRQFNRFCWWSISKKPYVKDVLCRRFLQGLLGLHCTVKGSTPLVLLGSAWSFEYFSGFLTLSSMAGLIMLCPYHSSSLAIGHPQWRSSTNFSLVSPLLRLQCFAQHPGRSLTEEDRQTGQSLNFHPDLKKTVLFRPPNIIIS